MNVDVPIKTFPVTVPLLSGAGAAFFRPPPEERFSDEQAIGPFSVRYSLSQLEAVADLFDEPELPGSAWYRLLDGAETLSAELAGADELLAPTHLAERWRKVGVIPYPHQLETARTVLFDMGGRAILADEVGLGKTIEAGLIIKEALLRGMVRKALILTPAGLCWQWYHELKEKFNLAFGMLRSAYDWERTDLLIASLDTAKKEPHRSIVLGLSFDILVVDEAHRLKNEKTQSYRFVNAIRRKHCLMLTATPMQNDLKELYNLIHLVRPGQLGTYRRFRREFVEEKRIPKQPEALKELLSRVMVRNRRGEGTVKFTERIVEPVTVDLSPAERRLYDEVSRFVREEYRRAQGPMRSILPLITLQREVCSTPIAAAVTLEKLANNERDPAMRERLAALLSLALATQVCSKVDALEQLIAGVKEKVIVFTEYRASQEYLRWRLERAGFSTLGFDGSLSSSRKEWIRELFRRQAQVLVSTESGGEGLNFQFCSLVVNYDLPWNPMRIEQRIGRVHRLGQTKDVRVYNLATRGTIEEHVLFLLYEKIHMFQTVLGEMDAIISRLRLEGTFEGELTQILVGSESASEMRSRLDALAGAILSAREADQKARTVERLLW